jgi:hypothetical protein
MLFISRSFCDLQHEVEQSTNMILMKRKQLLFIGEPEGDSDIAK